MKHTWFEALFIPCLAVVAAAILGTVFYLLIRALENDSNDR